MANWPPGALDGRCVDLEALNKSGEGRAQRDRYSPKGRTREDWRCWRRAIRC